MRLYFKPGACSLASRIVLNELGAVYEAVEVDTERGLTKGGADYSAINAKGYVPALELEHGIILSESPAILQYLADLRPDLALAPPAGTLQRTIMQEWLNFTSSELHKAFSPYFARRPLETAERERASANLARRIGDVERALADGRSFILGGAFAIADAYLFVVLGWAAAIDVDLGRWPAVQAYVARVAERPAVRAAMRAEGLLAGEAA